MKERNFVGGAFVDPPTQVIVVASSGDVVSPAQLFDYADGARKDYLRIVPKEEVEEMRQCQARIKELRESWDKLRQYPAAAVITYPTVHS